MFYVPYFCLNVSLLILLQFLSLFQPILVIIQVVFLLRASYRGYDVDESLWTSFWNFITLTIVVLFLTAIHVASILIVLTRFDPFVTWAETRKRQRELDAKIMAEFPPPDRFEQPPPPMNIPFVHKPQPRVKFAEQDDTFYYPAANDDDMGVLPPLSLDNSYHPASPKMIRSQMVGPRQGRVGYGSRQTKSFIV